MHKYISKEKISVIKSDAEIYYKLICEISKINNKYSNFLLDCGSLGK